MREIKCILVTGATGFVGSALVQALSARSGIKVIGAVRNRAAALPGEVASVPIHNLGPEQDWWAALQGVEVVVHLAARVHVMTDRAANPLTEFRRTNVSGTLRLARQAAQAGVRRFVFISSVGVNGGETFSRPFSASDQPAPHTPYAVSKYEAELALSELAEETGMEVVTLRPPLVYGPNAPGNFATLMKALIKGIPLPLGAVTENQRSFVALDNLVDLVITCLDHPAAANQTFLVSDGEDLSTAELLRRLGSAMGRPARLLPVPVGVLALGANLLGKPEIFQSLCGSLQVDMSRTRELLGWCPPIGVDEGLKRAAGGQRC